MTAAIHCTPSLSIPPSQNTAPVLEFRCLYSHDLRRKSKRWQDGFLRYHTFNKRVMVYDVPRNFIGDTHWKETTELQEGDELTLEKGVLVEVAEAVGTMETDLTPLFERKSKASPNSKIVEAKPNPPSTIRNPRIYSASQLRHKSLNTILGTPKGRHGKAVLPTKSPYETRKDRENEWQDERASKRLKTIESQPIRNLTQSPEIHRPSSNGTPLWTRTVDTRKSKMSTPALKAEHIGQQKPTAPGVIEIYSDTDNVFTNVTLPSTAPGFWKAASAMRTARPQQNSRSAPRLSPPISVSNKVSNVDRRTVAVDKSAEQHVAEQPVSLPRNPGAKALRLSSGHSRSTLLCQTIPQQRSKITNQAQNVPQNELRSDSQDPSLFEAIDWDFAPLQELDDRNTISDRIPISNTHGKSSKMNKFGCPLSTNPQQNRFKSKGSNGLAGATEILQKPKRPFTLNDPRSDMSDSSSSSSDAFEEMAIMHGRMDQRLLTNSSKASKPKVASISKPAKPAYRLKSASKENTKARNLPIESAPGPQPNQDSRPESNTSPRPFRRVRLANDAPIPSTADEWEVENVSKPKRELLRSKSVNATKAPAKKDEPPTLPSPPPVDTDIGPWSTEAFDLFDWRPPRRDKDGKLID